MWDVFGIKVSATPSSNFKFFVKESVMKASILHHRSLTVTFNFLPATVSLVSVSTTKQTICSRSSKPNGSARRFSIRHSNGLSSLKFRMRAGQSPFIRDLEVKMQRYSCCLFLRIQGFRSNNFLSQGLLVFEFVNSFW